MGDKTPEQRELARRIYLKITKQPELHDQGRWIGFNNDLLAKDYGSLMYAVRHGGAPVELLKVTAEDVENICGTTACIAGWAALLSGQTVYELTTVGNADAESVESYAERVLGLTEEETTHLFYASNGYAVSYLQELFGPWEGIDA